MDIYARLGVKRLINASGTITTLGGSLMPLEVLEAMSEAAASFVDMRELHAAAGRRIAELIGVEAAHVTAGAAAGITIMAAACMAGTDPARIALLPESEGMPRDFVVQKSHRNSFDRGVLVAGGRFVEIEPTAEALRASLGAETAGLLYTQAWSCDGPAIPLPEACDIAHAAGIPVVVDAAAEVPPPANLRRFVDEGADLVVFSGGKAMRGPQTTGVILGGEELVRACALNDCPNSGVGRGMKTGKEEIAGLVRAIELYVARDHRADQSEWERRVALFLETLGKIPGIQASRQVPPGVGQQIPYAAATLDIEDPSAAYRRVVAELLEGTPSISIQFLPAVEAPYRQRRPAQLRVHPHTLEPGEAEIVAEKLELALAGIGLRA